MVDGASGIGRMRGGVGKRANGSFLAEYTGMVRHTEGHPIGIFSRTLAQQNSNYHAKMGNSNRLEKI
jgi:hypothetical protein